MKTEKTVQQMEKERNEARQEYLSRPKHFAETFLEKYGEELEGVELVDILKTFFVYSGCANQFAVSDYIRKLKQQRKKVEK